MTNAPDPTPNAITQILLSDSYNLSRDYGKSTLDVPQRFVASYLWVLPNISLWGALGREVLSGWQFNGITTLSTGSAFNILSGSDTNFDGIATDRPNVVGNPFLDGSRSRTAKINQFFNIAAFAPVPAGTPYGNEQANMLIGPGLVNTDFSAFKNFPVCRESRLQFRAEIFNVFNNVNLGLPTATLNSPSFGKISSAGSPRIIQFGLRYEF
jgi:hypothetical protein